MYAIFNADVEAADGYEYRLTVCFQRFKKTDVKNVDFEKSPSGHIAAETWKQIIAQNIDFDYYEIVEGTLPPVLHLRNTKTGPNIASYRFIGDVYNLDSFEDRENWEDVR